MTEKNSIVAIYDFELFPYALGDVLTWNVRTAMRCEELGREKVDIYICADERFPAGIYQRGMINSQNFELFFSELYSAFGTHPKLGNIHIFRQREALLSRLQNLVNEDDVNAEAVDDYVNALEFRVSDSLLSKVRAALSKTIRANRFVRAAFNRCLPSTVKSTMRNALLPVEEALNHYFIKYIHSHESINDFAARMGGIPLLQPAAGCVADIDEMIETRFAGKKIVPFHLRLRRLDAGYGGEHSYARDSDFLEWYDFLRTAGAKYPEVQFVALGRLQEKPLELLRLPNVTSLRIFGMGLGHELALMLKSDLFIGTSSGFAALANFSSVPYAITKMSPGACHAYAIPEGAERLPFAKENQRLIYAQETSELLLSLLETGLDLSGFEKDAAKADEESPDFTVEETMSIGQLMSRSVASVRKLSPAGLSFGHPHPDTSESTKIDVRGWLAARSRFKNSSATTSRFYMDEKYRFEETAYLVLPRLEQARQALIGDNREEASTILQLLKENFPTVCDQLPQYLLLKGMTATKEMDSATMRACLELFDIRDSDLVGKAYSGRHEEVSGWRPDNWIVSGGVLSPLPEEHQPAFALQATEPNCYWHINQFVPISSDGRLVVRFDAKNSAAPSRHRVWIFEGENYRTVGDFIATTEWQSFEIPVAVNLGGTLKFQIDQPDNWQQVSVRDFQISGVGPLRSGREQSPLLKRKPVNIPMSRSASEL